MYFYRNQNGSLCLVKMDCVKKENNMKKSTKKYITRTQQK